MPRCWRRRGRIVDFATVNVSSPNTERLRELQGAEALRGLLAGVAAANRALARPVPVFLKIAPDLGEAELEALVGVALEAEVAGIVATNTTLAREGLREPARRRGGRAVRARRSSRARRRCWRGSMR